MTHCKTVCRQCNNDNKNHLRRGGGGGAAEGAQEFVVDAALSDVLLPHVVRNAVVNVDEGALVTLGPNVGDGERNGRVGILGT